MANMSVDYGGNYSSTLFNQGQSLGSTLASAFGGGSELKRQLLMDQHQKNLAYIDATGAKRRLDEQEYAGRDAASEAASELERARFSQGQTNARPAGSAVPAIVDVSDASARYVGATQLFANGATDAANALGRGSGAIGLMHGPVDQQRINYTLYGGNPTNSTVLGPNDTAGTNATIRINDANQAAKARGDILVDQANVPNKIAIDKAKAENELALDPMKNPDSLFYTLSKKQYDQGGQLSPDDQALLNAAKSKLYPQKDIEYEDRGTGEHVVVPQRGDRAPNLYDNSPAPVMPVPTITPPASNSFAPPSSAPVPVDLRQTRPSTVTSDVMPDDALTAPPIPVGQPAPIAAPQQRPNAPLGEMRFGSPKPSAAPTGEQGNAYLYARAKIDAEATLEKFVDKSQLPTVGDAVIRSLMNSNLTAQQVWNQLPDERSRAWFDAAFLFLTGTLRKESGAAIGQTEFAMRYPTLLPSSDASNEEIARKTAQRKSDIAGMYVLVPQELKQELDNHARRAGLKFHDEDVPFVPPYSPPPPAQRAPMPEIDVDGVVEVQ
jgi:hypothetical protein